MALSVAGAMEAGFLPALDEELADPEICKSRHLIPTYLGTRTWVIPIYVFDTGISRVILTCPAWGVSCFQMKARELFVSSPCAIHKERFKLCVDHPAPPREAGASPLRARARRSQGATPHPHGQAPVCALSLSLPLAYRFSQGRAWGGRMLSGRSLYPAAATNPHTRTGFSALP